MTDVRIKSSMSIQDSIIALSDRNPGGMRVLMELITSLDIDPYAMKPVDLPALLRIDSMGLYGEKIWGLYKDVCGQDIEKTATVIRGWGLGLVSRNEVHQAIDSYGKTKSFDVDDVVRKVQSQVKGYKKIVPDEATAPKVSAANNRLER